VALQHHEVQAVEVDGRITGMNNKTDRNAYNAFYKDAVSSLADSQNATEYIDAFRKKNLVPFYCGGTTKGGVRGLATERLMARVRSRGLARESITILDAGCGQGELSVWLAANGFKVYGVDISEEACRVAQLLAEKIGVAVNVSFLPNSLEEIPLGDKTVDFVIGHASLHHFIKYEGVSTELKRVLKPGGEMFFADSFGENFSYRVFQNKEEMQRLGDVILNRNIVRSFFNKDDLVVELVPYDWFAMLDKLLLKFTPQGATPLVRRISRMWWSIDRLIPVNGITLWLAGSVMTHVTKRA
jgi:2-polyprenyl-3-methyl-5-hydroxy-6-metoxy-1,4-benzoquinol methylase